MAICQVARLGEVSLEQFAGLIPRHALSCAACRDDCTILRNNQVQSADLGATLSSSAAGDVR